MQEHTGRIPSFQQRCWPRQYGEPPIGQMAVDRPLYTQHDMEEHGVVEKSISGGNETGSIPLATVEVHVW